MRHDLSYIAGIWPILYAFFDRREHLDRDAMRAQVKACLRHRPNGIAALGLATEVAKLSTAERHQIMEWMAEDVDAACPMAVTIAEATVEGQVGFARAAARAGISWIILQPPPVAGLAEIEYIRFFGRVADASPLPVALQNAPAYIGTALSVEGLKTLNRNHPNVALLKGEGPATEIAHLVDATEGSFRVLNGRGGLELPDNLRAGCVGMIPAPDCFDDQLKLYQAWTAGDEAGAEAIYARIAPAIVFVMQSIAHLLCYGKRITAMRLGMDMAEVHDRAPAQRPTEFGLSCARRYAEALGPLSA
ncbi:MAG: dihydrodipicolinate synthase family protein [Pseudomonadota bacterium]